MTEEMLKGDAEYQPHNIQIGEDRGGYAGHQKWARNIPFPDRIGNCNRNRWVRNNGHLGGALLFK